MMPRFRKLLGQLPLQTVLTIPFVLQLTVVVGVVGYLSFKNGQETVRDLASQLRNELAARILQQLELTVERPYIINQINANSLLQGDIDVLSGQGEHQLWQQAQVFPSTNLIYCATEADGAFLGVGRSRGGVGDTLQTYVANATTGRYMQYYEIDALGQRSFLRSKGSKPYDPRLRPWYKAAQREGRSTWSEVYLDFETALPTITANTPVYGEHDGQLLGVCATDIILSEELNAFLDSLEISKSGLAFIMEPSGTIIASSTPVSSTSGRGKTTELLAARDSENLLIQKATEYLIETYHSLERVTSDQKTFSLNGQRQYLEVLRFEDGYGLDWIVVLVVPEADFMEQINRNTQVTILFCLLALLITIMLGFLITQWLTRPLMELNATAKEIARGEWHKTVELDRGDVIGDLSRSFSAMALQLKESFNMLEQRIEERTMELIQLNQELQRLAHIDSLTQVANRRFFDHFLEQEWQNLANDKRPLSLLLCDVDYFKLYNDTYGHQAGDLCLQKIAQVLLESVHTAADLVARYGGEEFAVILSDTDQAGAVVVAKRIFKLLEELAMPHPTSDKKRVTLSMGITSVQPTSSGSPQSLVLATDLALYAAKAQGRGCFRVASAPLMPAKRF